MNADSSYSIRSFIKDAWRFIRPRRFRFWLATVIRLTGDVAQLYPSYAFAELINLLVSEGGRGTIPAAFWRLIFFWGLAQAWRYIASSAAKYILAKVAERSALDMGLALTDHLTLLDIAWHEKENAGNKLKKIQRGMDSMNEALRIWITNLIEIGVNFIGMLVIISLADVKIGAAMFFFMLTYLPLSFLLLRKATRLSRAVSAQEEEVYGFLFEILNNIRSVKLMGIARRLKAKLEGYAAALMATIQARIFNFQSRNLMVGTYANVFRVAVIAAIGYGILHGRFEIGFLVLFNGYFNSLRTSMEELSNVSERLVVNKHGIARAMEMFREPVSIDEESGKLPFPGGWQNIEFRNVSFKYGDNEVLQNLSFTINRNEKIGVVGLSGAGKSTLFKLLLKEYENYEGEILYDGVPLRSISKESYLRQVGVVLQDTEVFNFSLRENIMIAREDADAADAVEGMFQEAIKVAHVSDFLGKLSHDADTLIGEKGVKLSGGEKQRLGIARAIFKQPQVLFLDEATSHLDLESEEKIQDSLATFFQTVTAVVIAHRLTTIRRMDRIFVLENGTIIESGTFEELQARRGRFFELWEKQSL